MTKRKIQKNTGKYKIQEEEEEGKKEEEDEEEEEEEKDEEEKENEREGKKRTIVFERRNERGSTKFSNRSCS